ncbi:uncharacterized protein LOC115632959 [Scaptodrosophila lebanonensis]|uniref:Uncharacterized protein LOC115632959 n=1 Tax=Drosophila lebanonensis TaxID=7225 RepID=A0A6J2UCK3_DROLE|nr:uncharacterized protein LOC115632959 [Scaptodrosophila lebanonensis]
MRTLRRWMLSLKLLLRQHCDTLAVLSLLCLMGVVVLDFRHVAARCELSHWCQLLVRIEGVPMLLVVLAGSLKLLLLLGMLVWRFVYIKPQKLSMIGVKQRYRRFILMRLLSALDQLLEMRVQRSPRSRQRSYEFLRRRETLIGAIELFRCDARRIFERTDEQLCLSLEHVLLIDMQQEQWLLQQGYGKRLSQLNDSDIYKLLFDREKTSMSA